MYKIDLNCDLGESFGNYTLGMDREVIPLITSANVACGFHASDPNTMADAVSMAKDGGTEVGAHPGYPDLLGFGRRNMVISPDEAYAYTLYQLGALDAFLTAQGMKMQHVKPHGAMYNMAAKDYALAEAIVKAIRDFRKDLIVLALFGGQLEKASRNLGMRTASEFFADRAYNTDGTLVNRKLPGSMITDEDIAIGRCVRMVKEHKVETIEGTDIDVDCVSICVHGDNAKALSFVERIRAAMAAEGVALCPLKDLV